MNIKLPHGEVNVCNGERYAEGLYYVMSGIMDTERLVSHFGLSSNSTVLDIGCGTGRLATGIRCRVGDDVRYCGIDIRIEAISWCQDHITSESPLFAFKHLNIYNEQYNKSGEPLTEKFKLPFPDDKFDIIYLYSVFSHMKSKDVAIYLKEMQRVLSSFGKIFVTIPFDDKVSDTRHLWTQTPPSPPVLIVYYNRSFFEHLLFKNNLYIKYGPIPHLEYEGVTSILDEVHIARVENREVGKLNEMQAITSEEKNV